MATWTDAWMLLPKNSQSPTEIDDNVRGVKSAVERRIRNEHDTTNDATGGAEALDWRHKEGSARCWYEAAEPANSPSAGALAGGHLWVDSDDKELRVYDGAAFQRILCQETDYLDDQGGGSSLKAKVLTDNAVATTMISIAHGLTQAKIMGAVASILTDIGWVSGVRVDTNDIDIFLTDGVGTTGTVNVVVFYID